MKLGAYDYVPKPLPNERLRIIVRNALNVQSLAREVATLRAGLQGHPLNGMVASSPQMQRVFDLIRRVATHDVTVLIQGESGTGKELIARAIHDLSQRRDKPFVPLDCTTLPEALVESEIFGYEKGAFTGAAERKPGRFEQAHEGTLFLDEIGNLSPQIQMKLLRVIQEREFVPLGGKKPTKVDVRLIVATNADLNKAIKLGQFREDLYHRIYTVTIHLPPLRERQGDIPLLCNYFLERFSQEMKKKAPKISSKAQQLLNSYHWPGNVRELENTIKAAVLLADEVVLPEHLTSLTQSLPTPAEDPSHLKGSLIDVSRRSAQTMEKELIIRVLREVRWNKTKAARALAIDYKTLYNKMKKFEIE
jgi:DNA-binding NtrC family response regulator